MIGSAVSEPEPLSSFSLAAPLQQAGVEVEDVAGIGFAARRAAQQERHLAVGDGLLGQVVVDDQRVHAVVAEPLAHGATRKRGQELQRRGLGRGGRDHDGVFQSPPLFERADDLRHGGALLPDGDVDAVELGLLVVAGVDRLLVQDGVDGDGALAGLTVADDQLALAAADGDQGVDRLQAGLHRLVHRLARDDAGRLHVHPPALGGFDRALTVDRLAQRVHDAAEQALAHRHVHDLAEAAALGAFADLGVGAEDHDRRRCRAPG